MKWNGTVSHRPQRSIASRFAIAKASQPSSTALRLSQAVAGMADGLDRRRGPELLAQPTDADVDHVRARIEVITPDLGEEPLAADDFAGAFEQAVQELELAIGEIDQPIAELRLATRNVERERAGAQDLSIGRVRGTPQMDANPCEQLVEGERLRQVVARAEPEAVQLRRQIGARRDDHDRQLGMLRFERSQKAQAVEARQQQIEDYQIAGHGFGRAQPLLAVPRPQD